MSGQAGVQEPGGSHSLSWEGISLLTPVSPHLPHRSARTQAVAKLDLNTVSRSHKSHLLRPLTPLGPVCTHGISSSLVQGHCVDIGVP